MDYPDSMEDPNLTDLKGKGKEDKASQYFSATPDAETSFHDHYSSSFMDDDLSTMVKEVNNLFS